MRSEVSQTLAMDRLHRAQWAASEHWKSWSSKEVSADALLAVVEEGYPFRVRLGNLRSHPEGSDWFATVFKHLERHYGPEGMHRSGGPLRPAASPGRWIATIAVLSSNASLEVDDYTYDIWFVDANDAFELKLKYG